MKNLLRTKIWIGGDSELSEKIQKKLFELGYGWGNCLEKTIIECKSIFIETSFSLTYANGKTFFNNNDSYKEIFLSDLFDEEDLSKVPYTEWKVGDTVERIVDLGHALKKGQRVVIDKIINNDTRYIYFKGYTDTFDFNTFFKLVKRASTVQSDIQDNFILPEKWCTQHTQEVVDWLIKIDGNNLNAWKAYPKLFTHFTGLTRVPAPVKNEIKDGFTFVTTEQFKKYVLKQLITINQLNKQLNTIENDTNKENINSKRITESINRISGISSTREELRRFNYGFEKSYRRQRIGIAETGSRRR